MTLSNDQVSRRWILGAMLAGAASPVFADAPLTSIRPKRRVAVDAPVVPEASGLIEAAKLGGTLGFVVADAATGRVLEAMNPSTGQPPASVAKAMTALFALEKLGASHRFVTQLVATGPVKDGQVEGDLVLVGAGDPTLSTDHMGDMAARLAAQGIRAVSGQYLVYSRALPAVDQISADQPDYVGYNPSISGMNLNFNRVNFEWKRGADGYGVTMDARGERFMPLVDMARMRIAERDMPLFTYEGGEGVDHWTVASAALGKGGSRWMPVRHPAVYGGEVFRTLAAAQGIVLPAAQAVDAVPIGTVVVENRSDSLDVMLRDMLKFSTNLTAEVVGLVSSGEAGPAASALIMSNWAAERYGVTARFVDHSGLGGASRTSAADMVRTLLGARSNPNGAVLRSILRDVGMRDAQGKEIDGHPVRVLAKSGTLNFVSGLAGYIVPPKGPELAFAIFAADTPRRDKLTEAEREQPEGGEAWTKRARRLQGQLISRWAGLYA
jgi:serine-type D-Ala-D-Ala carboxypeptidase/endopeptidase (penicillin-binding protein 4)